MAIVSPADGAAPDDRASAHRTTGSQVKTAVRTANAPPPGGAYSQAIRAGDFVFLSGQTPRDLNRQVIGGTFEDQVRKVIENLAAVAEAAGSSLADAVNVRVYLRDWGKFAEMDKVFRDMFPEPRPSRTALVSDLPVEIEIEAVLWTGGNGHPGPDS
jgi:2-iminobutanoate/2-iminopropanoate deaminase